MLKYIQVRINIHETDVCTVRFWAFSYKLVTKINDEYVLKRAFEGTKFGPGKHRICCCSNNRHNSDARASVTYAISARF